MYTLPTRYVYEGIDECYLSQIPCGNVSIFKSSNDIFECVVDGTELFSVRSGYIHRSKLSSITSSVIGKYFGTWMIYFGA